MKLPFNLLPGSWGLKGTTRAIAEAEYTLSGFDLAKKIVEIKYKEDSTEYVMGMLEANLKYDKIDKQQYDKELATAKNIPWVSANKSEYDAKLGLSGFSMELDYNDLFVEFLRAEGFDHASDDMCVDSWFDALCSQIAKDDGSTESIATIRLPSKTVHK